MNEVSTTTPQRLRRPAAIFLGVLLALVALEVVLQVGHVVVWLTSRPSSETSVADDSSRTVLCVGDSFTFGIGASTPGGSYPAALEHELRNRTDGPWRVTNEGWPGRNSRELLENLAAQIERHAPSAVCILVGVNDRWSRPELLDTDASFAAGGDDRLRLRWRTGRLLALILAALRDADAAVEDEPPLVGAWAMIGQRVDFYSDGTGTLGEQQLSWRTDGKWIEVEIPGALHVVATWRGDGHLMQLVPMDAAAAEISLERLDAMLDRRIPAVATATADGRVEFAATLLRPLLRLTRDGDAWAARLRRTARRVALAADDIEAVAEHEAWLRARGLAMDEPESRPARAPGQDLQAVLAEHLRRAVELCQRHDAVPVLVLYPHDWPFQLVHERVAAETGVELVATIPALDDAARAEPGIELFVDDGHCNDRGYAAVARAVAAGLDKALRD